MNKYDFESVDHTYGPFSSIFCSSNAPCMDYFPIYIYPQNCSNIAEFSIHGTYGQLYQSGMRSSVLFKVSSARLMSSQVLHQAIDTVAATLDGIQVEAIGGWDMNGLCQWNNGIEMDVIDGFQKLKWWQNRILNRCFFGSQL